MKKISLLLMVVLTAFTALSATKVEQNIPYTHNTDEYSTSRCRLDVSYNPDTAGMPVVVWFHGGGLTGGEKFIPRQLAEEGYVVIAPNYRLIPKVGVSECIDDAAAAVAWAFKNAEKYGGDQSRIVVSGHSAGGYLTSMVGLEKKWLEKYGIDADSIALLAPLSGQVITHFAHRKLKGIKELQPAVDEFAPLFHIRPDAPEYLIITGDRELELFGRYEENAYMWRMLKLLGHPKVSIYELDGHNHGEMMEPAFLILKKHIKQAFK